jgi:N-acetylated-alpha-linked acidic dipeptidase
LSKTAGRLVLRIADADTPPMRFGDFAETVAAYLAEVGQLADQRREADRKRAGLVKDGAFRLASDPLKPVGAPAPEAETPHIELAALADAVDHLRTAATAFDNAYSAKGAKLAPASRAKLNALLRDVDQLLLDERGLPGRPWYQNLVYAPGRLTGYGAKTLPGVREAIEDRRFDDANVYAARTAKVLDNYATRLDQAREVVEGR